MSDLREHATVELDEAGSVRSIVRSALVHANGSKALARAQLDLRTVGLLQAAIGHLRSDAHELAIGGLLVAVRTLQAAQSLQDDPEPCRHDSHLGGVE